MAGCQLAEEIVNEAAAFLRSRDCIAIGEPPAAMTGHGGTIAAASSQSVTGITFSVRVSRMMGFVAGLSSADRYDLVVIGGGSAGLTAAGFAAQIGARVLIAAEQLGGDCTWTGCIPSKALIRAARLAHDGRRAAAIGVGTGGGGVDFARVMAEVRAVIARVYSFETPEALAKRGVEVAIGPVRFLGRETAEVGERRIQGDHFVVCSGAVPTIPAIPGIDAVTYLTYETVFDLERLPASLIVVGAGPTGVEMAQAFVRLGSKVTVIDHLGSVLRDADPEAGEVIRLCLEAEGIAFQMKTAVTRVTVVGASVRIEAGAEHLEAESLLLATGRHPRIAGLDLERAGVEVRDGAIHVDKHLRTTNERVYAAGDVTGGAQFSHYAGWQGYVATRNALMPGAQDGVRLNIPWAVFTDPEVAQAGLSEAEARAQFTDVKVHRLEIGRAHV